MVVNNSTPLGRILDHAVYKAYEAGVLQVISTRALGESFIPPLYLALRT